MQAWKEVFIRICQRHEQSSRSEGGIYKASAMKPLAPAAAFEWLGRNANFQNPTGKNRVSCAFRGTGQPECLVCTKTPNFLDDSHVHCPVIDLCPNRLSMSTWLRQLVGVEIYHRKFGSRSSSRHSHRFLNLIPFSFFGTGVSKKGKRYCATKSKNSPGWLMCVLIALHRTFHLSMSMSALRRLAHSTKWLHSASEILHVGPMLLTLRLCQYELVIWHENEKKKKT